MFHSFRRESIRHFLVHHEQYVEPIHPLNGMQPIPSIEPPVKNQYLANATQIYAELTSGESVTRHAHRAAEIIARRPLGPQ